MKIVLVAGTRPEVIKLAPVRAAALAHPNVCVEWIATGQHTSLADQAMDMFALRPDRRLALDWDGSSLTSLTGALVSELGTAIADAKPDMVVVQGDTASAFSGAAAAHLSRVPVAHVEAGLRSGDFANPFPEEGFRRLITPIADLNFAPTRDAAKNLRNEGIPRGKIFVTGNTVIDAVLEIAKQDRVPEVLSRAKPGERLVLVTTHRRENWGEGVANVCSAIRTLRSAYPDTRFILPAHLNPRVRDTVAAELAGEDRIEVIEPLAYPDFIAVLKNCTLVLSDSGGVQEEAPSFRVPVLVLRERTERMEAVKAGTAKLVGTDREKIVQEASRLLGDETRRRAMMRAGNPFGDGKSSERIVREIAKFCRVTLAEPANAAAAVNPVGVGAPAKA